VWHRCGFGPVSAPKGFTWLRDARMCLRVLTPAVLTLVDTPAGALLGKGPTSPMAQPLPVGMRAVMTRRMC